MSRVRKIRAGGTRGNVFKEAASERLRDAEILFKEKRFRGAAYLGGYAVECLLKWAITERHGILYLPCEFEIHDLDKLTAEAGLLNALQRSGGHWAAYSDLAETWSTELRYQTRDTKHKDAERLYRRIQQVYEWIVENVIP